MKTEQLFKVGCILALPFTFSACVDNNYDLADLDTTSEFQVKDLVLPMNLDEIYLKNIIDVESSEQILIDDNKYVFIEEGGFSSENITIPQVEIPAPNIESVTSTIELGEIPGITPKAFDNLEIRIERELGEKFDDYDRQFDELKAETRAELVALQNEMNNFIQFTFPNFEADIRRILNEEIAMLYQKFDSLEDDLKAYIYNELQKILEQIPEITTVWVIDPTTGELGDIQSVINNFYNVLRYFALTADEFDALGMTVDELEHIVVNGVPRGLTCLEWDMYAKLFINVDKDKDKVGSYLTGELVELEDNVNINNMLLKESGCYECEEWDDVGGDCDTIDALEISAYRWDWFSNNDYVA